jgi:hypothetical protein
MARQAHEGPFFAGTPVQRNAEFSAESHHGLIVRDEASGRFKPGTTGGKGRPAGSKNVLTTQFLSDLADCWSRNGVAALDACAKNDPTGFIRVVSGLLPKEALLAVSVDTTLRVAQDAASAFALLAKLPRTQLLELQKNVEPADG